MSDFTKAKLASSASSNKLYKEGSGTFAVSALGGAGETFGFISIPHEYTKDGSPSDELLYQVSTNGGPVDGTILPWSSNDGRITQYAYVDSTNLTIVCISSDSSGSGAPARTISYYYRLLIP